MTGSLLGRQLVQSEVMSQPGRHWVQLVEASLLGRQLVQFEVMSLPGRHWMQLVEGSLLGRHWQLVEGA